MNIYLDSRDLIVLVERSSEEDMQAFAAVLAKTDSKLLYSMCNILECCGPLIEGNEKSTVMRSLNRLEQFPHLYIAEALLGKLELSEAANSFLGKRDYQTIAIPFVPRWDHVISPFRPPATGVYLQYSLAQTVFELWATDKRVFDRFTQETRKLQQLLGLDRSIPRDLKNYERNFQQTVARDLRLYEIDFPQEHTQALADWIYADANRCPDVRLGYEMFHKLVGNITDKGTLSDIPDSAHISCLPYCDVITLDNRMREYVAQVDRAIGTTYSTKVCRNLAQVGDLVCAKAVP